jgi:hypothetical protein
MKAAGDWGDMRRRLSTLWIFASLNYIYADVITLFDKSIPLPNLNQTSLLAFGALVETAFAMVLLSRLLAYRANRWVNTLVGVIQTISVLASLLVGVPAAYAMFAIIEIVTTLVIIWQAWVWKQ